MEAAVETPNGGPETEVLAKAQRRRFTAEYKRRILKEADRCTQPGEIGALLRREGLCVLNPPGFHDSTMMDLPEIYVDYDLGALLKGKARLEEVRLNLNELVVVKSEQGKVNLHSLQAIKASKQPAAPQQEQRPAAPPPPITVDTLELNIGKVVYKDYSAGTAQVKEFNVDVHERFHHITNPYALVGLIVTRALIKTTVARLTNLDLGALQSEVTTLLRDSLDQTLEGVRKGAIGPAEDALKGTTDTLKNFFGQ